MTRTASFVRVGVAYLTALAAAAAWLTWVPATPHLWLDGLLADVVATLVIFGFSRAHHNSSFYDAYWSVAPPILIGYWWVAAEDPGETARGWLLMIVVLAWAIRLTANWVRGFPGLHHEDWRYPMLRDGAGRWELPVDLFAIHLIPTLQVFLGVLPAYVVLTRPGDAVGWLDVVATAVGLGAVLLAYLADEQMRRFIADREPGQALDGGLWAWSRHPNYFGEISFWFSLALFGLAAAPGEAWWLFVGVVAMVAMFLGASIPMMEKRSLERRPEYRQVIDTVPMLVPRPPRRRA